MIARLFFCVLFGFHTFLLQLCCSGCLLYIVSILVIDSRQFRLLFYGLLLLSNTDNFLDYCFLLWKPLWCVIFFGGCVLTVHSSHEIRTLHQRMRLVSCQSSSWVLVHRLIFFIMTLTFVLVDSPSSLRPSVMYSAMVYFHLLAYNLVGCVFESFRRIGEAHAAQIRTQVKLLFFMWIFSDLIFDY